MTREKTWVKPAVIAGMIAIVVAGIWMLKFSGDAHSTGGRQMFSPHREASARNTNAATVTVQGGEVRIPAGSVSDGNAHFFFYNTSDGKKATFFLMQAKDGSIRAAFDACIACNHAKLGYRQENHLVVCNNCGMSFTPDDIGGTAGGCNPIPISKKYDDGSVVFKAEDIEAGSRYF